MGIYLNPRNGAFKKLVDKELYIDKSLLIDKLWKHSTQLNPYICFSRPRRFGKSTDANMLVAYFSKGCDSAELFEGLKLAELEDYEAGIGRERNAHSVIHLDMQTFLSRTHDIDKLIEEIYLDISEEIEEELGCKSRRQELSSLLEKCYAQTGEGFIFIVDEWDCVFREFRNDKEVQKKYLDYLRLIFKDKIYVEMVYMTGILPIKKYGTHSALNMFDEISMLDTKEFSEFAGFTDKEVEMLCREYGVDYEKMKEWYNGYEMHDGIRTYSPRSVTASIFNKDFANYWSQTETYDALKEYIDLNYDGLRDAVIKMIAGEEAYVNVRTFQNSMGDFATKDDVMTLLIHLGYLGYITAEKKAYIPNLEVKDTFIDSIETSDWDYISKVFRASNDLLECTMKGQADKVAEYIEHSHYETSILQYNDENALSYTIGFAYITARQKYTIVRELPTGKGFADLAFIPKQGVDAPAMLIELKYNQGAESGMKQLKEKKYYLGLEAYLDRLLLVSISYDKNKKHTCVIERYEG